MKRDDAHQLRALMSWLRADVPQAAAECGIDPPVSVPSVPSAIAGGDAGRQPPLEPPGDRLTSWLQAGPNAESSFVMPNAIREG
jgi:hypothetical protein